MSASGKTKAKKQFEYVVDLDNVLGDGYYGRVVLAEEKVSKKPVACKIIKKPGLYNSIGWLNVKNELDTLIRLPKHPNLPEIYSLSEDHKNYYIFMEYIDGQTLIQLLDTKTKPFKEDVAIDYFKQIVSAVEICHKNNIIHRDIKLENIMVTKDGVVKLVDFGFSNYLFNGTKKIIHDQHCGSAHYAAPEIVLRNTYYGDAVDVWCLGITLYTMIQGYFPFNGFNKYEVFKSIIGDKVIFYDNYSNDLMEIITWMLSKNWSERPSIEEIKNCSWLS